MFIMNRYIPAFTEYKGTVTVFDPEPPGPVQVIVNAVVTERAPVDVAPLVGLVPLQPPLAMHSAA